MVVSYWAKRELAFFLGGSNTTNYPTYFIIGSGSGLSTPSQTELISPTDRQKFSESEQTTYTIKWTADWNSVEMSGLHLEEFGVITSGTALTGSIWSRTSVPSLVFDGTNELRIEEIWEVY
jgi:hypothetical protein